MEQFRQIGEVLGSLKALMVFQHSIQMNQRQCCFLLDVFTMAYETIADEMRINLRFEEKNKWGILEQPLKELYKVLRDAEIYMRNCFEKKDWRAHAIILYQNRDCVEYHIHNLFCCIPIIIGAIETGSTKYSQQLLNLLLKNLDEAGSLNGKLLPCSILLNSKDYQVRKRLGNGGEYKEISWLGETFVLRQFKGEIESLIPELSQLLSLSHPNILQFLCGFTDDEKKECYLVTENMSKNLGTHVKEVYNARKRMPLSLPVAVDTMLQIARGMEYLHSKKIYHGDLRPSNILAKTRSSSSEAFIHVKVTTFGLITMTDTAQKNSNQSDELSHIWHAPEVLMGQGESLGLQDAKYTEKSDVYSFGMICFELLTGKVPFEDAHLQGDKMSRNIRAGERPLFPHQCPKYMTTFTKRCWHTSPDQRPSFSSICRILRYIKRFLLMNPDYMHPDTPVPLVDYYDIESRLIKKFPSWISNESYRVSEIPFQMFAYQVMERERCMKPNSKDNSESDSEAASMSGDEHVTVADDPLLSVTEKKNPVTEENMKRRLSYANRSSDTKSNRNSGTPKGRSPKPPPLRSSRTMHLSPDNRKLFTSSRIRRKSGHASDSELV